MSHYNTLDDASATGAAPWDQKLNDLSDFHVAVFRDRYPVTPGHLLFVPTYNTQAVLTDAFETALRYGERMVRLGECDGFNIGFNCGASAGQTVMYPHVHLIPRRSGDCEDPAGGVRGVIPGQANYKAAGYIQPA
jgi:diadenosine tetraphosphate (Ap4A) HIT family hydrolase